MNKPISSVHCKYVEALYVAERLGISLPNRRAVTVYRLIGEHGFAWLNDEWVRPALPEKEQAS